MKLFTLRAFALTCGAEAFLLGLPLALGRDDPAEA